MPRPKGSKNKLPQTRQQAARFTELEREVMRRRLELQPPETIQRDLGLDQTGYDAVVLRPEFQAEYELLAINSDERRIGKKFDRLATEALDTVRWVMRNAASDAYRLRAALEILDRSGNVKVEKRLQINADAETIIKHLNQLGTQPARDITEEAEIITHDPITLAAAATRNAETQAD
jgi:hypothetical protein